MTTALIVANVAVFAVSLVIYALARHLYVLSSRLVAESRQHEKAAAQMLADALVRVQSATALMNSMTERVRDVQRSLIIEPVGSNQAQ